MASGSLTPSSATTGETNSSTASVSTRSCTTCGRENTTDSRFCRHCGALLPAVANAALNNAAPSAPESERVLDVGSGAAENGSLTAAEKTPDAGVAATPVQDEQLSPAEVEMRRARQLLDRSFSLSERGDLGGAILACRQAISLVPDLAEAHSMLGLLLERSGDTKGAIEAYEETLLLAPDSMIERDSLQRLRAQMPQQGATPIFHFDDSELFPESPASARNEFMAPVTNGAPTNGTPVAGTPVAGTPVAGASVAAASVAEPESADSIPGSSAAGVVPVVAAGAVVAASAASASAASTEAREVPSASTTHAGDAPVPATTSSTHVSDAGIPSAYAPPAPVRGAAVPSAPLDFGVNTASTRPAGSWWQTARSRPSFYLRALPLTGVAVAGLMFMLWARNVADSRAAVAAPPYISSTGGVAATGTTDANASVQGANADANATGTTPAATGTPTAPDGITGSNVPITNDWRTVPPNAPAVTGTTTNNNPTTGTTPVSSPATAPPAASVRGGASPPPRLPSLPPATILPGSSGGTSSPRTGGGAGPQPFDGIPPARILNSPPAPEVVQAVPSSSGDGGGSTSGGGPLNPAGSSRRGSVRVISRPSPSQAAPRPENAARSAEDAARDDANNGRTGQAIGRTTAAINTSSDFDRAYRLQQRALLRLDAGDNSGAITDFQAAISAYNDQISRGTRVSEARRGISSCQSGLRLAQANNRR